MTDLAVAGAQHELYLRLVLHELDNQDRDYSNWVVQAHNAANG